MQWIVKVTGPGSVCASKLLKCASKQKGQQQLSNTSGESKGMLLIQSKQKGCTPKWHKDWRQQRTPWCLEMSRPPTGKNGSRQRRHAPDSGLRSIRPPMTAAECSQASVWGAWGATLNVRRESGSGNIRAQWRCPYHAPCPSSRSNPGKPLLNTAHQMPSPTWLSGSTFDALQRPP